MHYVMDDLEVDFLLDAVDFVAKSGQLFLRLYDFDLRDGAWNKKNDPTRLQAFSLESALQASMAEETPMPCAERQKLYSSYLEEALQLAEELQKKDPPVEHLLDGVLGELQFFALPECCIKPGGAQDQKGRKGFISKLKSVFSSK